MDFDRNYRFTIFSGNLNFLGFYRKYLTFFEFIYNNQYGLGYCQTSTESIYLRIIITEKIDPIFVQKAMDFGFVD